MQASSYIKFVRKITGSGLTPYLIRKKFLAEVDKDDYSKSDMEDIFQNLYKLA